MKKMNNKGFSLVELIIVIAIMAILAGAIAPALIKYIKKSRKSTDISNGGTIQTAVITALANQNAYDAISNSVDLNVSSAVANGQAGTGTAFDAQLADAIGNVSLKPKYATGSSFMVHIEKESNVVEVYVGDSGNQLAPSQTGSYAED